jgi:hypothetical protein
MIQAHKQYNRKHEHKEEKETNQKQTPRRKGYQALDAT